MRIFFGKLAFQRFRAPYTVFHNIIFVFCVSYNLTCGLDSRSTNGLKPSVSRCGWLRGGLHAGDSLYLWLQRRICVDLKIEPCTNIRQNEDPSWICCMSLTTNLSLYHLCLENAVSNGWCAFKSAFRFWISFDSFSINCPGVLERYRIDILLLYVLKDASGAVIKCRSIISPSLVPFGQIPGYWVFWFFLSFKKK